MPDDLPAEMEDGLSLALAVVETDPTTFDQDEMMMAAALLMKVAGDLPQGHQLRAMLAEYAESLLGSRSQQDSEMPPSDTSETSSLPMQ